MSFIRIDHPRCLYLSHEYHMFFICFAAWANLSFCRPDVISTVAEDWAYPRPQSTVESALEGTHRGGNPRNVSRESAMFAPAGAPFNVSPPDLLKERWPGLRPGHLSLNASRGDTLKGAPAGANMADSRDTFLGLPLPVGRF